MIPIFDHHVHMDARSAGDYELMALAGVRRVLVPCSATQEKRHGREAYAERFDRLLGFERERASCFGVELLAGLAVNAADIGSHDAAWEGVEEVEARLGHPAVRAVGELALRSFEADEIGIFERQLEIATRWGLPVIVESPPPMDHFERLIEVLAGAIARRQVSPHRICLVDLNCDKLRLARTLGIAGYGLPVSPALDAPFCLREKLGHLDVLRILDDFGAEGLMLNSGIHVGFADPLCLPKTVLRLRLQGLDGGTLRNLAHDHAEQLFQRIAD